MEGQEESFHEGKEMCYAELYSAKVRDGAVFLQESVTKFRGVPEFPG